MPSSKLIPLAKGRSASHTVRCLSNSEEKKMKIKSIICFEAHEHVRNSSQLKSKKLFHFPPRLRSSNCIVSSLLFVLYDLAARAAPSEG